MPGPCLCGDPYCGNCGDPGLAKIEAAEEWAMDKFTEAKLNEGEYRIAVEAGIAAVKAAREHLKDCINEALADEQWLFDSKCAECMNRISQ